MVGVWLFRGDELEAFLRRAMRAAEGGEARGEALRQKKQAQDDEAGLRELLAMRGAAFMVNWALATARVEVGRWFGSWEAGCWSVG